MSKLKLSFLIIGLALLTSGCISIKTGSGPNTPSTTDAGVFKTVDMGDTWAQKVQVETVGGQVATIAKLGVSALALDPSDHNALYYGSLGNGLFYSYDAGNGWTKVVSLPTATIQAVAVDPGDKCVIYASTGNKVFRSDDCSRTWTQVFIDSDTKLTVPTIAIDPAAPANVYIGTSRGELIHSPNKGASWTTLQRLGGVLSDIAIDTIDSRNLFAAVEKKSLFRSRDGGVNVTSLKNSLKDFSNASTIKDIALAPGHPGLVFIATGYGILKSSDYGDSWTALELIPPEKKTDVNAIALNPDNVDEIYYITDNTFYRTADGGVTWTPKALPTARTGVKLLLDPKDPKILYLGVTAVPAK